ncbi:MAG: cell division protein SepF [Solirubrobacterales bacterium]|jgi:cell division inhibitor SepF
MAFRDTWHRALVYFGLAEDPEYPEPDLYEPDTGTQGDLYDAPAARSATVSPIRRRGRARDEIDDIFADDEPVADSRTRSLRPVGGNGGADVRVHLVTPFSFNDAQEVADKFKQEVPVILNLQTTDSELAKRLIDFTSGLTYALGGGMQKIADKTFLLTPRNVEVSAEEKARLVEKGFFNQS